MTSEERRANILNQRPGSLTGYDCPLCKNRGYSALVEDGFLITRECSCMAARRVAARMEASGLGNQLDRLTFATFQTPQPWQKAAKAMAMDFVSRQNGAWFVAAGAVGSGKTHLCTAICAALLQGGRQVRYMLWRDDGARMKAAVNDSQEYRRLTDPMKHCAVLYIDDFWKTGQGKPVTEGDINLAFDLLNARYSDPGKVTILSTEKTLEELLEIDEAIGSRIFERSKGFYLRVTGPDKNWRLRPALSQEGGEGP